MSALPRFDDGGVVSVPTVPAPAATAGQAQIARLIAVCSKLPQVAMPVTHHFAPGIYIREIFMPKGAFVIGHRHRTEHFNLILKGSALVWMESEWVRVSAGMTIKSGAGVQKALQIEEDCVWQTVHANPDDETEVFVLEERLAVLTPEFIAEKGGRRLDDFRMSADYDTTALTSPTINSQPSTIDSSCPSPLPES